jgi:hypothetical protein
MTASGGMERPDSRIGLAKLDAQWEHSPRWPVGIKEELSMTTRTVAARKKPVRAKKALRAKPKAKAKALATRDPVRKSPSPVPQTSLLENQLAMFRAAWAMSPMALFMRQQAAMFDVLASQQSSAPSRRRKHS